MVEVHSGPDFIRVKVNDFDVAFVEDSGNGMDAEITEGDNSRMSSAELISIAVFILEKARERSRDEAG